MNDDPKNCPDCGKLIPPDAPGGLCPECLLNSEAQTVAIRPTDQPLFEPAAGETLGAYRIVRRLGKGGMGQVFEAEQLDSRRRVALKIMNHALASETDTKRFLREGRLAASISHPNVVYVYGTEEIDGIPAIAMELVHGGTLQDMVKNGEEPLAVAQAVELTLQMIAGLETAEKAGVLHRDIKPANCFLASDGTVKIGDFGLSVSTIAHGESMLTTAGSVLGTPSFASPEQLRGGDLDVRSDIYSVGATLYFLLTGRVPFEGGDLVQLIASVLDREPVPPVQHRADLPRNLSKVILRCLEKDPSARYSSYRDLVGALEAFTSVTPSPALLGRRLLASFIDDFFIGILPAALMIATLGRSDIEHFHIEQDLAAGSILAAFTLGSLLYFGICEGIWGAAPGKFLCRLRVESTDGGMPGIWTALCRAAIYKGAWTIPAVLGVFWTSSQEFRNAYANSELLLTDWIGAIGLVLLVTMRKRNGFAAIHDLITKTRVVTAPSRERRPALDSLEPAESALTLAAAPIESSQIGPYAIDRLLCKQEDDALLSGRDEVLQRRVWIRLSARVDSLSLERHALSRPGRLRWLNGRRDGDDSWDAFEAPSGQSFLDLVHKPQAWSGVRYWLQDLAEEYRAGQTKGCAVPCYSLDRIWITQSGQAIILDFPSPTTGAHPPQELYRDPDLPTMQSFLHTVAARALGQDSDAKADRKGVPLSLHAHNFIVRLKGQAFKTIEIILGNLQSIVSRPATVSPTVRLVSVLLPTAVAGLLVVCTAIGMTADKRRWDSAWQETFPQKEPLRALLDDFRNQTDILEFAGGLGNETAVLEHMEREARLRVRNLQIYAATEYGEVLASRTFWTHTDLGESLMEPEKAFLNEAPEVAASAGDDELASVQAALAPAHLKLLSPWHTSVHDAILVIAIFIPAVAMLSLLATVLLGQPLLLKFFGLAVVNKDGVPASRVRLVWRWLLGWGPLVAAVLVLFQRMETSLDAELGVVVPMFGAALVRIYVLLVILAIYAIQRLSVRPWQGWHDEVSGTFVVPR